MKKKLLFFTFFFASMIVADAQILFQEDFESGNIPADWIIITDATDGGWKVGSAADLSSAYFPIAANGTPNIAATNDDACNCDKSNERFIMPRVDLTGQTTVLLKYDAYYTDQAYQNSQENASVFISTDSVTWELAEDLAGEAAWVTHSVDLSPYAGEDSVYIAFAYDDGGDWLYGFGLDNVTIEVPPTRDAAILALSSLPYGEENVGVPIAGTISNNGIEEITSLEISYSINGDAPVVQVLDNLNIAPFSNYEFQLPNDWVPATAGDYMVDVTINTVNGMMDENPDNNDDEFETRIYEKVVPPNRIEEFILAAPVLTEVADITNQLDRPTDLDFFPILGRDELWIINQRTENAGGSTLTISDASSETPSDFLTRVDGNSWHFMSLPTGIAFSPENFNFANSPGVQDANHSGGTFTGPSLWSSDPLIYAQPSGGNGSHLDMLHGSPMSMGIAHEVDNVFWIYDDWNKDIVRYDFVEDHGPGNDDHSDAIVRRFKGIGINADGNIPNHMIMDKMTGWLYFVDNGLDRVMRLDINSGTGTNNLPEINEPLAEHTQIIGFNAEIIIDAGLERPCGIEIMDNRLLVGDYATGDIVVFDMDNNFEEIGRIQTGEEGLTGIKIGPDGSIWFTNRIRNTVTKAEPGEPNSTEEDLFKAAINVSPNPTAGPMAVALPAALDGTPIQLELFDVTGKKHLTMQTTSNQSTIDMSQLPSGVYTLTIQTEQFSATQKIVKQ